MTYNEYREIGRVIGWHLVDTLMLFLWVFSLYRILRYTRLNLEVPWWWVATFLIATRAALREVHK